MYINWTDVQESDRWGLMMLEASPKGDFDPRATPAWVNKTSTGLKDPTQLTACRSLARCKQASRLTEINWTHFFYQWAFKNSFASLFLEIQNNNVAHGDAPRPEPKSTSAPGPAASLLPKNQAKPTREHVKEKGTYLFTESSSWSMHALILFWASRCVMLSVLSPLIARIISPGHRFAMAALLPGLI